MTTPLDVLRPQDIITLALKDAGIIGVGQTALAEDMNDGLTRLNMLMAQWGKKRFLVFQLTNILVTSTGVSTYTVGPGGQFNTGANNPRPDRLENGCFFRQLVQSSPNQVDYPLELLESWEDYNRIVLKQLQTFPAYIFYDTGYPLGTLYVHPVPSPAIYAINILVKGPVVAQFLNLTVQIGMPNEYYMALYLTLATILRAAYRLPPDSDLTMRAREAREVIRGANTALARLRMPAGMVRPGVYNPYSDQIV
jgi:hypothetical protein